LSSINGINSEIGPLKKVMLHRPGKEVDRLTLTNRGSFLFDDLLWLEEAQREHDYFAMTLEACGSSVIYLEDCLNDILNSQDIREQLIKELITEIPAEPTLRDCLIAILGEIEVVDLREIFFSGLTKSEFGDFAGYYKSLTLSSMEKDDFLIHPLPNLYFQRDPYVVIGNKIVIGNMNFRARKRESLLGQYVFENHRDFSDLKIIFGNSRDDLLCGSLEGGDILVLSDDVLAIGISQRTSAGAVQALGSKLSKAGACKKIIAISLPKTRSAMHLDTVLTMIDENSFAIYKDICHLMNIWELDYAPNGKVEKLLQQDNLKKCLMDNLNLEEINFYETGGANPIQAERDQWNDGANVFAVAPGKIITYERNVETNKILTNAGIEVLKIRGSELGRGRGGPRCMTFPIARG